jgi:uncharacterized protein (TIGR03437 family)
VTLNNGNSGVRPLVVWLSIAVAAVLSAPQLAFGSPVTLFNNFGAGGSFGPETNAYCVGGNNPGCGALPYQPGFAFTPATTAYLSTIQMALYNAAQGGAEGSATVFLVVDNHGLPGSTVLEQWSITPTADQVYTLTSVNHALLTAGAQYWLVAANSLGRAGVVGWNRGSAAQTGPYADMLSGSWLLQSGAATQGAFEIQADTNAPGPSITTGGIVPIFSTVSTIQPGEWVSIFGTNLAASFATWTGNFPVSLANTSVTINGKSAYLWYVSPTQINLQAPNDTTTGPVSVVVTTPNGTASSTVMLAQYSPSFSLLDTKHVTGIIIRSNGSGAYGGGTYDIIGPTGTSLGYATTAATAGDVVELFAVGLGPTNPPVSAGQPFAAAAPVATPVNVLINNVSVAPVFAGLSSAGLYQVTVVIPSGLGKGDVPLVAMAGGLQTQAGVWISLQ